MFTGIIEGNGKVIELKSDQENLHITLESKLTQDLKIDQSLAHNGVCLTVVDIQENQYVVTAVQETLLKSNLSNLKLGDSINLERAMKMNGRLDGHIVQGHVDQTGKCIDVESKDGSWIYKFEYASEPGNLTIEKGSISINGVSLTVINSGINTFSVAIIPYTYNHTNFNFIKVGDIVNLEFDMIGKYIKKIQSVFSNS